MNPKILRQQRDPAFNQILDRIRAYDNNDHNSVVHIRLDEYTGRRFTFFADPDDLPLELYEAEAVA